MMAAKAGKRPLRSLSVHEKLNAIRRVHDGESKASVARDIGVPESTLRGWCKNEDKISYLSRQSSSPETDESQSSAKRQKVEDLTVQQQPFNLSMKSNGADAYSASSGIDYSTKIETKKEQITKPTPIKDIPKSTTNHMSESDRNRAELARLSVELGLNRPEMFAPNLNNTSANLAADLSANINFLFHWNSLMQKTQQQQQQPQSQHLPQTNKTKPVPTIDPNVAVSSTSGLLTTVDQDKTKLLPKDKMSVNESVWYWLKTQRPMFGMSASSPTIPNVSTSSLSPPTTSANNTSNMAPMLNGVAPDTNSWFWNWYKQLTYSQLSQPQSVPLDSKPILYQQLTRNPSPKLPAHSPTTAPIPMSTPPQISPSQPSPPQLSPAQPALIIADQQHNAENLSMHDEERQKINDKVNNNTPTSVQKTRSVLDNLLFNNNNNVTSNRKDEKQCEASNITQIEAVEHGEKFLKWLEECSDPSVTAMQIMQFRSLLNNVKSGADRRNGDLQNKTKVKRK